ncbi:TPA: hypothetical protein ACH3X2_001617 [Trebouxia sp. C0005]
MERSGPDSMLAFQNSKLKAQLEVKRDEFADLDRRHQQLVAKQASYQDNLLIIDRLWRQVNGDIQALTERATGEPVLKAEPDYSMKPETVDTKEGADIKEDPFLARLLQSDASMVGVTQQSLKLLWTDASELEVLLRKRLNSTVESFAKVLDAIRQGQQQRAEQAQQIEQQQLPDSASATTTQRLANDIHNLQRTVDGQQAYIRTLEANLAQTDDEFVKHKEQIRDMNNQLADLDEQLAKARKSQRTVNGQHPAVAKAEVSLPNGAAQSASSVEAQKGLPKEAFLLTKSLEETEQLMSKRERELEQEREAGIQLAREIRDLKSQLSSQVGETSSQTLQEVLRERDAIKADRNRLLTRVSQLERDVSKLEVLERQKAAADREAKHAHGMQEASLQAVRDRETRAQQLQSQLEQAQQALHAEKAQFGQQGTLLQCRKHMDTLQTDLLSERQKVKQLAGKGQQVATAKQEVLEAVSALQAKEKQLVRLQLKLQRQQNAIQEIEALKVRSEDLRVFVEVLQSLHPEPADMVQLRASEAQLRGRVAKLQADMDGHHLQQTIKQCQQAEARAVQAADDLASERDLLQVAADSLRHELSNVRQQLAEQQAENSAVMTEIDNASEAYESMQSSNTALVRQLGERDARISQMTGEQLRHEQGMARCRDDKAMAESCSRLAQQHRQGLEQRLQELQLASQACSARESEAQEQLHSCNANLAQVKRDKDDMSNSLKEKCSQLADLQRESADKKRALDAECEKLSREKHKRQRIEEDKQAMQSRLEQAQQMKGKSGMSRQAEEELEALRGLLRCNVCHERQKDVIITKCMHMFCKPCIQRNLDARHRKCPGCGAAFGNKDVQQFFFT